MNMSDERRTIPQPLAWEANALPIELSLHLLVFPSRQSLVEIHLKRLRPKCLCTPIHFIQDADR